MIALLLICSLGQIAEPYTGPVVIPPSFPPNAITHTLSSGRTIGIVPEEPINETYYRTETRYVDTTICGMPCGNPAHHTTVARTVRIPVGQQPMNRPTPLAEIERVLRAVDLTTSDVLYDLGCGDGRVCILAAAMGAKAVGIDKREKAIELAKQNSERNRVSDRINWFNYDVFTASFSRPTIIYTFFDGGEMSKLKAYVEKNAISHVRAYISYKHEWPGVKNERVGDFFIWKPKPRTPVTQTSTRTYVAPQLCPT